jgi:phosphogluconate dehydratase
VTDGRLSGASGKVPAAIHVSPEALCGGNLARVRDGDRIRIDVPAGRLELLLDEETLKAREYADPGVREVRYGWGRQIFAPLRGNMQRAEEGASSIFTYVHEKCEVHLPFEEE